jgi:citrate/tricarballylate utilization protein
LRDRRQGVPQLDLLQDAERQMTICNACRYCEGFCAVFPAMELRTSFKPGDLIYLSNLCHDCRACFYACQYAPPHAFAVNIPHVLAEIRSDIYADYSWPRLLARLRGSLTSSSVLVLACLGVIGAFVLFWGGPAAFTTAQTGAGAFYRVIPYAAMVAPALLIVLFAAGVFWLGVARFWRDTRAGLSDLVNPSALANATGDVFGLRYLRGGGDGCNYPDERFSQTRRWLHHLTYYGFLLDLASTTAAAIYDHAFGLLAPYPLLSLPVVLGTVGGVMLMIGTAGLLWLKFGSDRAPASSTILRMDVAFLVLLFATALTGLLLLVLRDSASMGTLLIVHLALVAGLFLSLPYGKFAHAIYRYAALVRNAMEQSSAH